MLALAHYLLNRHTTPLRPIPDFDPEFYLRSYPDVAKAGLDALEHYMIQGFREARRPFDGFDPLYYRRKHLRNAPESNPFLHYLENRERPDVHPCSPESEISVFGEIKRRTKPGPFLKSPAPFPKAPFAARGFWPIIFRSFTPFQRTTPGGAMASRSGPTCPAAFHVLQTIISHAFHATSVTTL